MKFHHLKGHRHGKHCVWLLASEVTKLIFAVLDVSFNCCHYSVIIKRQFLYINNVT